MAHQQKEIAFFTISKWAKAITVIVDDFVMICWKEFNVVTQKNCAKYKIQSNWVQQG